MRGRLLIAGRKDAGEKYLARMIAPGRLGADPFVRVLAIVRYPRQHALYWPDVAVEIPPVEAGCICRLHIVQKEILRNAARTARAAAQDDSAGWQGEQLMWPAHDKRMGKLRGSGGKRFRLYAASLAWAHGQALARCENAAEREILLRQMAGEYQRKRQVVRLNKWEVEKWQKASSTGRV